MKYIEPFEGERAANYDQQISLWIPHYPILPGQIAAVIRSYYSFSDKINILVAGCGTGTEMQEFLRISTGWHCTGVDPSAEMIAQARQKLHAESRFTLKEGTVESLPSEPAFDAATLILVMHFLPDDGDKLQILQSLAHRMKKGSPLVLVDMFKEAATFGRYVEILQAHLSQFDIPADRLEQAFNHIQHDIQAIPEQRVKALLQEAGFGSILRFSQHLMYGGWVAEKM